MKVTSKPKSKKPATAAKRKTSAPDTFACRYESSDSMTSRSVALVRRPSREIDAPVVRYSPKAKAKIDYLVDTVTTEVGWWGTVERTGGIYTITDVYVPEQIVSGATTEISANAMADLAMKLEDEGIDSTTLLYWGHSHVNFPVNPSMQDENQVQQYLPDVPYFIRGIYNKRGESKVDVYDVKGDRLHERVENKPVYPLTREELNELDAILLYKVAERPKPKGRKLFPEDEETFGPLGMDDQLEDTEWPTL